LLILLLPNPSSKWTKETREN